MNKIESAVAAIPYENVPSFPYQYTDEVLAEIEQLLAASLPGDFKWYLLNTGWRKITWDYRFILIPNGEYIYRLMFDAVEHQAFAVNRYRQFVPAELLPYNKQLYYPFGKISGEINPSVSFQLLISLNEENYGSVWVAEKALKIADSFTGFLEQIGPDNNTATRSNEALFTRLLEGYISTMSTFPTSTTHPEQLFSIQPIVIDGVRNVEYQHYSNGLRIENEQQMKERVEVFATIKRLAGALQRRDIQVGTPQETKYPNYYTVAVSSTVGDKNKLQEEFLLYHDQQWTMVRRTGATIDDVKVKGVGTFTFDDTYKWELKKKVKPAWSEIPAVLHVEGEEDAITVSMITFIKELINRADFKPLLEAHILSDKDNPGQVWPLLGKSWDIYIDNDHDFHLCTDYKLDEEHGLTIRVWNWQILAGM